MDILIFKWRDELIQVNPNDIVYFEADGNYSNMILVSGKRQLLTVNLSKVQVILEEQLEKNSNLFERIGRDLIIRKQYLFSIHTLKKKLILAVPGSDKFFELHVSKEALKKIKEDQEVNPKPISTEAQLRDLQTRKIYSLGIGGNRFGRKSTEINHSIDNGDNQISRQHFNIEVHFDVDTRKYGYYLIDLQSANGTFLDNSRLVPDFPNQLKFGYKIRAGKTEFVFEKTDIDRTEIAF